jgi:subtilisin family serine protease
MLVNAPSHAPRELVLVVDPEAGVRLRGNKVISLRDVYVKPIEDLIRSEQADIKPLFGVSEDWLSFRTSGTDALMGEGQKLDLSIFYKITAPDEKLESLAAQMRELSVVQSAYIKPGASLPFIDRGFEPFDGLPPGPTTRDFTKQQLYLNSATDGIDARYAWKKKGGGGAGVNIIDIEGAWRFSHEDLVENLGGLVGGVPVSQLKWRKHGTAVLGILGGDRNGFGVTGICPEAYVRTISIFANSNGDPSSHWSSAAAIRLAADLLRPGDIILIELHQPGPAVNFQENDSNQKGYIPVEWWPCDLAAIMYATIRGIIVVEAGGNGRENLEDAIYCKNPDPPHGPFPFWWRNPFKRDPFDSRAILVGAGKPPGPNNPFHPPRSRMEFSNFGCMIDTQGWGDDVVSSGGDNELNPGAEEDRWYTSRFSGTSSASAIVAGACACLQGISKAAGKTLKPSQVRDLLRDEHLGSPQQGGISPTSERIGPQADLRQLIAQIESDSKPFLVRLLCALLRFVFRRKRDQ